MKHKFAHWRDTANHSLLDTDWQAVQHLAAFPLQYIRHFCQQWWLHCLQEFAKAFQQIFTTHWITDTHTCQLSTPQDIDGHLSALFHRLHLLLEQLPDVYPDRGRVTRRSECRQSPKEAPGVVDEEGGRLRERAGTQHSPPISPCHCLLLSSSSWVLLLPPLLLHLPCLASLPAAPYCSCKTPQFHFGYLLRASPSNLVEYDLILSKVIKVSQNLTLRFGYSAWQSRIKMSTDNSEEYRREE